MRGRLLPKISLALMIPAAFAQSFEVASIRPAGPIRDGEYAGQRGGPGTNDPELYTCGNCDLFTLTQCAYDLAHFRIVAPDWMHQTRFEIRARVPQGATREQMRQMLQNLLAARFRLAAHRDHKEMPMYRMVVAHGGIKMTASAEAPESNPPEPPKLGGGWGYRHATKQTSAEIAK